MQCQTKLLGKTAPSRDFKGKASTNEHSLKQINSFLNLVGSSDQSIGSEFFFKHLY